MVGNVLADRERRRGRGRGRVSYRNDWTETVNPEVVDQRTVPVDRLGTDSRRRWLDVFGAERGHVVLGHRDKRRPGQRAAQLRQSHPPMPPCQ